MLSELNSKRKNEEFTEAMYKEAALHLHEEQWESVSEAKKENMVSVARRRENQGYASRACQTWKNALTGIFLRFAAPSRAWEASWTSSPASLAKRYG